jgi:hypothetical protein
VRCFTADMVLCGHGSDLDRITELTKFNGSLICRWLGRQGMADKHGLKPKGNWHAHDSLDGSRRIDSRSNRMQSGSSFLAMAK